MRELNRRDLLKISGAAAAGAALPSFAAAQSTARPVPASYPEILREPDSIVAYTDDQTIPLTRQGQRWNSGSLAVELKPRGTGAATEIAIAIEAPGVALQRVRLRWLARMPEGTRILGDQWERSYGDLEWRGLIPDRVMPWYFLAAGARATHAYGVRTGAAAFCFWQADAAGISMWLDVRNGGAGVDLGARRLDAAVIRSRHGAAGETPFQVARPFCRELCETPRLPAAPVYGGNNWYYAYGRSTGHFLRWMPTACQSRRRFPGNSEVDGWTSLPGVERRCSSLQTRVRPVLNISRQSNAPLPMQPGSNRCANRSTGWRRQRPDAGGCKARQWNTIGSVPRAQHHFHDRSRGQSSASRV